MNSPASAGCSRVRHVSLHIGVTLTLLVTVLAAGLGVAPASARANALWTRTYAPPGALGLGDVRIAVAGTGDVYVAAWVVHAGTVSDLWLARYSAAGARKWIRTYDGSAHGIDVPVALVADRDGNVSLLADSRATATGADWLLLRYRRDGRKLWSKRVDGGVHGEDVPTDLVADAKGNLYAVGQMARPSTGTDLTAIKYAPSGRRLWTRAYDIVGQSEIGGPAALGRDGRFYVCGQTSTPATNLDLLLVCYTTSGEYKWSRSWTSGNRWEMPADIVADSRGPVVVGWNSPPGSYSDALAVAYEPDGDVRWTASHDGAPHQDDGYVAAGLDSSGRVYVAGYDTPAGNERDFFLGRYPATGGALQSTSRNGLQNVDDEAAALAVSADGHVYAAGSVKWYAIGLSAFYLAYAPDWTQIDVGIYDGPGNASDAYQAVGLSSSAVYLAGTSYLSIVVEKYAR